MRTQGSLRLILNTKLWPQMQVDKASEKSVRITAMDTEDQGVKVFLISVTLSHARFRFHGLKRFDLKPEDRFWCFSGEL